MKSLHVFILTVLLIWALTGVPGPQAETTTEHIGHHAKATVQGGQPTPIAEMPSVYLEFAPVVDGTEIIHEFVIRNTGNAELRIQQVQTG